MAMVSPTQAAKNWGNGLRGATEKIKAGVMAVTEAPTMKAARAVDRMVAGIQRAAAEGKIQAGLEAVTNEDWKRAMLDKGVPRIATGATQAEAKMADFLTQFLPHVEAGQRRLESMPRGDLETNIQRMVEMARHNSQFRYRRRGGI